MNDGNQEKSVSDLKKSFYQDGFLYLRGILPLDCLSGWRIYSQQVFRETFTEAHRRGHTRFPTHCRLNKDGRKEYALSRGVKNGYREIVMRSLGRYELSLLNRSDFLRTSNRPGLDAIKGKLPFAPSLLDAVSWDEIQICNLSLVVSTPGSTEQSWHSDGPHLSLTEHMPCHCLNIFIPLHDVPLELGPTEFRPGSHFYTRNLAPMMLAARAKRSLRQPETPILSLGDVVLFDYRILHRGKANVSVDQDRTYLVVTVAQPWYKDILNFPLRSLEDESEHLTGNRS